MAVYWLHPTKLSWSIWKTQRGWTD